jgi:hypothetical protein
VLSGRLVLFGLVVSLGGERHWFRAGSLLGD